VQELTDLTPALEHTPTKEGEVWSTQFHKDEAVSPDQTPSGNTGGTPQARRRHRNNTDEDKEAPGEIIPK